MPKTHKFYSAVFLLAVMVLTITFSIGLPIYIRPFYYAHVDALDMPETYDVGTDKAGLDEILEGGKRVFLELFTPDMRQIKVGDIFEITDGVRTHRRRVTSLHAYSTFAQLEDDFESYELGFGYDRYPGYLAGEMRKLYRFEDVVEYGALAIVTAPVDGNGTL